MNTVDVRWLIAIGCILFVLSVLFMDWLREKYP